MKRTRKPKTKTLSAQIKSHSTKKIEIEEPRIKADDLVPMGSTLLNLAMSGNPFGGAQKGKMVNIIGASHGGKTILALTSFAEACRNASFDDYSFVYDDVERANSFDMGYLFGEKATERIEEPRPELDNPFSETVQHFHANINYHLEKENPCIYVLDSFDALDALEDQKKIQEMTKALETGKHTAGTYGMAKAKAASSLLRNVTNKLANTDSILFIISQIRDNVDSFSFKKETRSGGRALKFYATHEMWLKPIKTHKKKETPIGNTISVEITKNKITGRSRKIEFDVYYDYGIDDIGSCIDYLIKMKYWAGGGNTKINHKGDFEFPPCLKAKMVRLLSSSENYKKLQLLTAKVWNEFEQSIRLNRPSKY